MNEVEAATAYVRYMLRPVQHILDQPTLTDFHIIGAGEGKAFVDIGFGMEQITLPYSLQDLKDLALYAAAITRQDISERTPIVSTKFPDGERVNIVQPPTVEDGLITFSLRKPKAVTATPDDLKRTGVFNHARHGTARLSANEKELRKLYHAGHTQELLALGIESELNIVFSGGVGSGKTHLARTYASLIPVKRRVVTVEDTRELLDLPQPNMVNLLYSKGGQSVADVKAEDLVECSMRLGMDWLLIQELRDQAAYAYKYVLDSGHNVLTTVHANSAAETRPRIRSLIKEHPRGMNMGNEEIMASLVRGIDLIVHMKKEKDPDTGEWRRFIDEVLYDPEERQKYDHVPLPVIKEYA